jgi:hypothetical protein
MSKKCKHGNRYDGYYEPTPNIYIFIILILIVLQWFKVSGYGTGVEGAGLDLTCNGGLFIIALFLLIACGCWKGIMPAYSKCE